MTRKKQTPQISTMLANGEYYRQIQQLIGSGRIFIDSEGEVFVLRPHYYRITVQSIDLPTYADLIANYGEGNVSDVWEKSKYKLKLHKSLRKVTPSTGDKIVFVKKFDRAITSEKVIEWGKNNGYRLAFPAEREAFSKANPDLQRKFWIVDLGSFLDGNTNRHIPILCGSDNERILDFDLFDIEYGADDRFLFVCE